jgi:two-component system cell cycle response regulator
VRTKDGRYRQRSPEEDRLDSIPATRIPPARTGTAETGAKQEAASAAPDRPSRAERETRPALDLEARARPSIPPITAEYAILDPGVPRDEAEERHPVLLFLTGTRMGAAVVFEGRPLVIGRDPACDVVAPDDAVSRQHARFLPTGQGGVALEDLRSRNGTVVNGERITRRVLADGDRIMLGRTVLKFSLQSPLEENCQQRVYELSTRDGLTNLYNRRYFDERLQAELAFARRHGSLLGLLLLDLDHFKRLNDTHGHIAGDRALMEVGRAIGAQVRGEDMVARYGGEEFVVLVRDIPREGVVVLGERLRASVEALRVPHEGKELTVTVSIGAIVIRPARATTADELIATADRLLYEAKSQGRNRVRVTEGGSP